MLIAWISPSRSYPEKGEQIFVLGVGVRVKGDCVRLRVTIGGDVGVSEGTLVVMSTNSKGKVGGAGRLGAAHPVTNTRIKAKVIHKRHFTTLS